MTALTEALVAAQAEMPHLTRDATADADKFSYKYLTLEKLLAETVPVLNRHGLALIQYPTKFWTDDGRLFYALETELRHVSGDKIDTTFPLACSITDSAQKVGSALTYARRYSLLSMLGLSADEDDDGKQAEPKAEPKKPPASERPVSSGTGKQIGLNVKLLQDAFPEHPGEGRTWTDMAKAWLRDKYQKESVGDLTEAQAVALNDWLEDKYREAQRDEQIPFDGGPEQGSEEGV